jgi:nucleoside diphosphate kinase
MGKIAFKKEFTLAMIKSHVAISRETCDTIWTYGTYEMSHAFPPSHCPTVMARLRCVMPVPFAKLFYAEHKYKPYFEGLIRSVTHGPVEFALLVTKSEPECDTSIVDVWRSVIGTTDPLTAEPGTIRAMYGIQLPFNAVHGSDSEEAAFHEARLIYGSDFLYSVLEFKCSSNMASTGGGTDNNTKVENAKVKSPTSQYGKPPTLPIEPKDRISREGI